MSSKKRKGGEHASEEAAIGGNDGGDESIHTKMMRVQRDEFKAKLDAALLENERLKAEPCARCHYYSDWTVRVRTMSGQVHSIACPDGPKTLVAHVKQKLAQFDPKCHILQQVTLVLPCEASNSSSSSSSSSSADPTDPALVDDRTLVSCGLSKRDVLDLLLVDINWSDECREMIALIKDGGEEIYFTAAVDDDLALAFSWALVNVVCLLSENYFVNYIRYEVLLFGYLTIISGGFTCLSKTDQSRFVVA
jgi:hypothetical protein